MRAKNGGSSSLGVLQVGDIVLSSSAERRPPWMNVSEPRVYIVDVGIAWMGGKIEAWSEGDGRIGS